MVISTVMLVYQRVNTHSKNENVKELDKDVTILFPSIQHTKVFCRKNNITSRVVVSFHIPYDVSHADHPLL